MTHRTPRLDVRIRFGNAAMLMPADAADALEDVVRKLRDPDLQVDLTQWEPSPRERPVYDASGNTVGHWAITYSEEES